MTAFGGILKNIFKARYLRNALLWTVVIAALFPAHEILISYPRFKKALIMNVEDEAQRAAAHLVSGIRPDSMNLTKDVLRPAFGTLVRSEIHDFGITKLKVFDKTGEIIYSTDPAEVGQVNVRDYFHEVVATGRPFTVTVARRTQSAEGDVYSADVVETYVPVMSSGEFLGAFEFYFDITIPKARLDMALRRATVGLYILATGLIVVIFVALVRASREELRRVEIENKLRRAERMRSLGNLAGGVAHEINNLLLPILALSKMTMKQFPDGSRDRKRIEKIVEAGESAKSLVAQVMAFGREDDSKMDAIDICRVVHDAMTLLCKTLYSTIMLRQDLDGGTGTVRADAGQIRIVLANLLSNAQDSIAERTGTIDVSLRPIQVDADLANRVEGLKAGSYAKLTVSDTGKGMDEETLARVFDPFFTTKDVGEGKGLGLPSVHGIVETHGGAIDIASAPHVGTTVDVYLPLIRDRNAAAADRAK